MSAQRIAGNAIVGRRRIWVPLATVGLLVILGAIEFIAAKSLPSAQERLEPGTVIEFGAERNIAVEVDDGWSVDKSQTNLDMQVVLVHGQTTVALNAVQAAEATPDQMWDGMSRLLGTLRYGGDEVRIGSPSPFTTSTVTEGLAADLEIDDRSGTSFVLPSADREHAVYARILASAEAPEAESTTAEQLINSVSFSGEDA